MASSEHKKTDHVEYRHKVTSFIWIQNARGISLSKNLVRFGAFLV